MLDRPLLVLPYSSESLLSLQPLQSPRPKVVTARHADAQGLFPDVFHMDSTTVGPELVTPTKFEDLLGRPKINLKSESGKQQRKLKTSSGPVSQMDMMQMTTQRPKGKRKKKR